MSLYQGLAATAKKLLTTYGRDVTRRRSAAGAYDPATGTTVLTPSDSVFKGAIFDFDEGVRELRGVLVTGDDKRLYVESAADPNPTDKFLIGGVEYSVQSVGTINPGGTQVIHDVHLRR